MTVRLDNWSVTYSKKDWYTPPELASVSLQGIITGHETIPDGSHAKTGTILEAEGRIVTTNESPTTIKVHLGRIRPEYRRWLRKHRPEWDWRNPVTIFGK